MNRILSLPLSRSISISSFLNRNQILIPEPSSKSSAMQAPCHPPVCEVFASVMRGANRGVELDKKNMQEKKCICMCEIKRVCGRETERKHERARERNRTSKQTSKQASKHATKQVSKRARESVCVSEKESDRERENARERQSARECERERESKRERERESERASERGKMGEREGERGRQKEGVCVCVCMLSVRVCVLERTCVHTPKDTRDQVRGASCGLMLCVRLRVYRNK